jgi:hypothetical protein
MTTDRCPTCNGAEFLPSPTIDFHDTTGPKVVPCPKCNPQSVLSLRECIGVLFVMGLAFGIGYWWIW